MDKGRTIRIPVHMSERLRKAGRAVGDLSVEHGREPTEEEVAARLGWEAAEVREVLGAKASVTSLSKPVGTESGGSELGELVEDEWSPDTPEAVIRDLETDVVQTAVDRLPARARRVLIRRYGLDGHKRATLEELSRELGISRERVRQIQRDAENTLRTEENRRLLREAVA